MKKLSLMLILTLLNTALTFSQEITIQKYRLDSTVISHDYIGIISKEIYSYNQQGKIATFSLLQRSSYDHNSFYMSTKQEYSYNSKNNIAFLIISEYEEATEDLKLQYKYEYSFSSTDDIIEIKNYERFNSYSNWELNYVEEYEYNLNRNLVTFTRTTSGNAYDFWSNGCPTQKEEYVYNSDGRILNIKDYEWKVDDNSWNLHNEYVYAYSEISLDSMIRYNYNSPYSKTILKYNELGKIIERLEYDYGYNEWEIDRKTETTYNSLGDKIIVFYYSAYPLGEVLELRSKREYNYDSNGIILETLGYDWSNGSWKCGEGDFFISDSTKKFDELILPDLYPFIQNADDLYPLPYFHEGLVEEDIKFRNMILEWQPADTGYESDCFGSLDYKSLYYYSEIIDTLTSITNFEELLKQNILLSNSPNPFTNETSFTINLQKDGIVKLAVYNLFGQQVDFVDYSFQRQGKQELTYQTKSLLNGTYIAKLFLNDAMIGSGKLLKME